MFTKQLLIMIIPFYWQVVSMEKITEHTKQDKSDYIQEEINESNKEKKETSLLKIQTLQEEIDQLLLNLPLNPNEDNQLLLNLHLNANEDNPYTINLKILNILYDSKLKKIQAQETTIENHKKTLTHLQESIMQTKKEKETLELEARIEKKQKQIINKMKNKEHEHTQGIRTMIANKE